MARHLLARLNRDGRGTRVEFHPLDQAQVPQPHQRAVEFRTLNVRRWDRIVAAWVADDDDVLDHAWVEDAVVDLDSHWASTNTSPTSDSPPEAAGDPYDRLDVYAEER